MVNGLGPQPFTGKWRLSRWHCQQFKHYICHNTMTLACLQNDLRFFDTGIFLSLSLSISENWLSFRNLHYAFVVFDGPWQQITGVWYPVSVHKKSGHCEWKLHCGVHRGAAVSELLCFPPWLQHSEWPVPLPSTTATLWAAWELACWQMWPMAIKQTLNVAHLQLLSCCTVL